MYTGFDRVICERGRDQPPRDCKEYECVGAAVDNKAGGAVRFDHSIDTPIGSSYMGARDGEGNSDGSCDNGDPHEGEE